MSFDLLHIWSSMGLLSKSIAGVLVLMAIASVAVTVDRVLALRKSAKQSKAFAREAKVCVEDWDMDGLVEIAARYPASSLARLTSTVARRYQRATYHPESKLTPAELARSESERCLDAVGEQMRQGMSILASVGSVAPFIGLLGTVVGIIGAFQGIAMSGSGGLGAVSVGIAEALVETALGLMVAIPAVLLFNYLTTRISAVEQVLRRSVSAFIEEMEIRHDRTSGTTLSNAA
jgi:biopolymer transport protein ExbB